MLESTLGPGTDSLAMQFGICSGPVTESVLRNEIPRFQLFGDTMNTATRMESTGIPNESTEAAALVKAARKGCNKKDPKGKKISNGHVRHIVGSTDTFCGGSLGADPPNLNIN